MSGYWTYGKGKTAPIWDHPSHTRATHDSEMAPLAEGLTREAAVKLVEAHNSALDSQRQEIIDIVHELDADTYPDEDTYFSATKLIDRIRQLPFREAAPDEKEEINSESKDFARRVHIPGITLVVIVVMTICLVVFVYF